MSITRTPLRNTVYNHFPSSLKTFLYSVKLFELQWFIIIFRSFNEEKISTIEIRLSAEMEKKGRNHKMQRNIDPKMGLNTFPNVLDVSIIPNVELIFRHHPGKDHLQEAIRSALHQRPQFPE